MDWCMYGANYGNGSEEREAVHRGGKLTVAIALFWEFPSPALLGSAFAQPKKISFSPS
jgi:hypothetical protein